MTLQLTIKDCAYYHSEEDDAESDPNSDPKVSTYNSDGKKIKVTDTYTTNRNYPPKVLINRLTPDIIPFTTPSIDQKITDDAAGSGETLHARRTILSKEIIMDAARSAARVFQTHADVIWNGTNRTTPRDGRHRVHQVEFHSSDWCQYHRFPKQDWEPKYYQSKGSIGPQWIRDVQQLDTSINGI